MLDQLDYDMVSQNINLLEEKKWSNLVKTNRYSKNLIHNTEDVYTQTWTKQKLSSNGEIWRNMDIHSSHEFCTFKFI